MNLPQKVAANTLMLVVSRFVVAGSGLAGVAVATRYLGPDDFGQLTVALVFVSVLGFFSEAGLYTVVGRELAKRPDEQHRLLTNAFTIGLIMSAGAIGLAGLSIMFVYGGPGDELTRLGIAIVSVPMLAAPLGGITAAYLLANQRAAPTAVALVVSSVAFVAGLFIVIELDLGFGGLAACFAVSGLIPLLLPFFLTRGLPVELAHDRGIWRELVGWALPQAGVLVLGVIYFRLDTFLLSFLSSDAEVGRYGVAYRVLEVLMLVPIYFMSTLFPEIARQRPRSDRLNEIVQGAFSTVALAVMPLVILVAVFAEEIVAVAGGRDYLDAAPVLRVLVVAVALLFFNTVLFQTLVALNRQRNLFFLLLIVLVGNVALNIALIPSLGGMGAALALVATEAAALILSLRLFASVGTVPGLRRPLRLGGAAALTAIAAIALGETFPLARPDETLGASFSAALPALATLTVGALVTFGVWTAGLVLFRAVPSGVSSALAALRRQPARDRPELV
ncbi:MAG: flippase [Actinomycetota bacterium]|nr:flippase [Actinomycetota bacterium]